MLLTLAVTVGAGASDVSVAAAASAQPESNSGHATGAPMTDVAIGGSTPGRGGADGTELGGPLSEVPAPAVSDEGRGATMRMLSEQANSDLRESPAREERFAALEDAARNADAVVVAHVVSDVAEALASNGTIRDREMAVERVLQGEVPSRFTLRLAALGEDLEIRERHAFDAGETYLLVLRRQASEHAFRMIEGGRWARAIDHRLRDRAGVALDTLVRNLAAALGGAIGGLEVRDAVAEDVFVTGASTIGALPDGEKESDGLAMEIRLRADGRAVEAPARQVAAQLLYEGFEGAFPGTWNVFDADGGANGEVFWDDTSFRSFLGSWSAWCADGGAQGSPAGGSYANNMNAWMIRGPFDLSDAIDADFSFRFWNRSESGFDYFKYLVSINGTNFHGFQVDGDSQGWQARTMSLQSVPTLGDITGEPQVWVAFKFDSDSSVTQEGPYVDEVFLDKTTAAPADLDLELIDVASGTYAPGDSITVSNRTRNIGGTTSDPYRITFYASTNTTITASDHSLGFVDRGALSPGALHNFSTTATLPVSLPDGTYYIGAILTVSDASSANNVNHDATPITVASVTPADLDLELVDAPAGTFAPGASITIGNLTRNIGGAVSDPYRITFYASTNTTITASDHSLGFVDRAALAAGGVHNFSTTATLPASLPNGTYYIGAILTVSDGSAANNVNHDPTPITVSSATPADLDLELIDVATGTYAPGDDITIVNRIRNIGGAASDPYRITFYASTNTTITAADQLIGFVDRASLAAGGLHNFSSTGPLPASLPEGTYYIGAILTVSDASAANNVNHDPTPITVAAQEDLPCLILVHGTRVDDFDQIFRDTFESGGLSNWTGTPINWINSWILGHQYWQEHLGLSTWGATEILPDQDSLIPWATGNGRVAHFVVRWDGAQEWFDDEASGRVADQIIRATNGDWDEPGDPGTRSRCTSSYPDGRFWVIAHSGGANIMDFILGNADPSTPNFNFNGPFDQVAERIERVIAVGGAHRGTEVSNQICEGANPVGTQSFYCGIPIPGLCTEARLWLRTDNTYQVETFASAPAKPIWLAGGFAGGGSPCSTVLNGQDDGVLSFASQFACSAILGSFGIDDVCDNSAKMESANLFNIDAADETHSDEKNNRETFGDRERKLIPDSPWTCSGVGCLFDTVCSDLSFANLLGHLADPVGNGFSGGEHDSCESTLTGFTRAERAQAVERRWLSGQDRSSSVLISTRDEPLAVDSAAAKYRPVPLELSGEDGSTLRLAPSAWTVAPGDAVTFTATRTAAADGMTSDLTVRVEAAGGEPALRLPLRVTSRSETEERFASPAFVVPPVPPVAGSARWSLRYSLENMAGDVQLEGQLIVVHPILEALEVGEVERTDGGLVVRIRGRAVRPGVVHLEASVYDEAERLIAIPQTRAEVEPGPVELLLFLGPGPADGNGRLHLRHVSVADVTTMPSGIQPLWEADAWLEVPR